MIIKSQKKNIFLYIFILAIALAYFVSFLSMDGRIFKKVLRDHYFNFYDYAMTFDLGLSSVSKITLNQNYGVFFNYGLGVVKKIPEIFFKKIQDFPSRPPLKTIYIDIKFKDYNQLLEEREKAVRYKILHEPNKVKAEIRYNGEVYKAKIRLKGDLIQHWRSRHQMSLRVSLKGKNYILGFKKFSLHKVQARQFPYDHVFQSVIRRAGNLSPEHKYIRVYVNGENWGLMNVEEHMSKELLEKQGRKDSIIVKFGNEEGWYYSRVTKNPDSSYSDRLSDYKLNIGLYSEKKYLKSRVNRERLTYLKEKRLMLDNADLYNIDRYAIALIMAKLWNNTHTLSSANERNYFNPYLLKLEPITTDQDLYSLIKGDDALAEIPPDIYQEIIKTEKFKVKYFDYYNIAVNALKDVKGELSNAQSYFPVDNKIDADVIANNIKLLSELSDKGLSKFRPKVNDIETVDKLPTDEQAEDFYQHLHVRHYEDGTLKIYNLLPDAVGLENLVVDKNTVIRLNLKIPGYSLRDYKPYVFETKLQGIYDGRIIAETVYRGNRRRQAVGPSLLNSVHNPLLMSKGESSHEFLSKIDERKWKVSRGVWNVNEPIVIRGDLELEEGTELYFSDNAYLIVIGSIDANGKPGAEIVFAPQNKTWKGLYVIGEGGKSSKLNDAIIKSTSGLVHGMLNLTGGVTFYDVNLLLRDVHFEKSFAEDALNLVRSSYRFEKVYFNEVSSDAFDSDFSSGKIIDSDFNGIGGDALDFSGSYSDIKNLKVSDVLDKAISVGEKSSVTVAFARIDKVGVGIAAKDGSSATVSNSSIKNYNLHAAMTYEKKGFYDGESRIDIINTSVDGDDPFAMQGQTKLLVDGVMDSEKNIDVRTLYKKNEIRE